MEKTQEACNMEKNVQALDDNMLENIIGGVELGAIYTHICRSCPSVWRDDQPESNCPICHTPNTAQR